MKRSLLLFIFSLILNIFFIGFAHAGCPKKATSNEIILFVDMNGGTKEIEETRKAACEKGQELIVYPEQTAEVYKMTADLSFYGNRSKALNCEKNYKNPKCIENDKKLEALLSQLQKKSQKFSDEGMRELLSKINSDGKSPIKTIVLSGHSDASTIFGTYGSFDTEGMQKIFSEQPDKGHSANSLILLACYSANPSTIITWKKGLPELKLIAGSDSSASASDRPAGLKYLKDLLLKTDQITKDADQKNLKKRLSTLITTLNEVNSAIYVDGNKCGEVQNDKKLFYTKGSGTVKVFNPDDCIAANEEYEKKEPRMRDYVGGKIEAPVQTHGTELRNLYTFLRQNAYCLELEDKGYDGDLFYGLLFYNAIKVNAVRFYKKEADEIAAILEEERHNPEPMLVQDKTYFEKIWPLTEENIRKKTRAEIIQNLQYIVSVGSSVRDNDKRQRLFNSFYRLDASLNTLGCISPLWHEEQAVPAPTRCEEE